jgi:hypothetical protein
MSALAPGIIYALDDWYRLNTFNFAPSFVEFNPPPPAYPDVIESAVVTQAIGAGMGVVQTRYLYDRRQRVRHRLDAWPMPFVSALPPGTALTLGLVAPGLTEVFIAVGGGLAGQSYDLKCKVVLNTGVKLEIPAIYSVIEPGTSIIPVQLNNHLIDPNDPTTFMRDYVFDFGRTFPTEFTENPPPTIAPTMTACPGVTIVSGPTASGSLVAVRIYCTLPGVYTLRCKALLSNGFKLSIPWTLNAFLGGW